MKKLEDEKQEEKPESSITDLSQLLMMEDPAAQPEKLRMIGLYGEVTEENAAETTYS